MIPGPPFIDPVTIVDDGASAAAQWPAWLNTGSTFLYTATDAGLRGAAAFWYAHLFHSAAIDAATRYLNNVGNITGNGTSLREVAVGSTLRAVVTDENGTPREASTPITAPGWHLAIVSFDGSTISLDLDDTVATAACVGYTVPVGGRMYLMAGNGSASTLENQSGAFFGADGQDLTPSQRLVVKSVAHQGPAAVAAWLASIVGGGEPLAPPVDHGWVAHDLTDAIGGDNLTKFGTVDDVYYDPTPVFW